MAMHTVIMAGGAGTRLLPLTADCPKPLAPLCGAPIMDYTLRLLQRHGIAQADATLWYRPQDVEKRFGTGGHGVALRYVVEDKPVGTAGSVLMAVPEAKDTVLVLSGDGLTDIDLTAALAFHRQHGGAATLVLKRVSIPLDYGVVVTDKEGRITRFIEKPDWSRVISSLVNTGVYFLEPEAMGLIPRDKPFDFGRELFPLMLEKGLPIYGYETKGYWCDVGNPEAFLQAQADLISGKTQFEADRGLRELPGVSLSADSYVSPEAQIGAGAVIRRSCVLPGAYIGPGAQLDGAIVCAHARVEQGAALHPGSVLGAGSAAGAFSTLRGQARIWPGIRLPDDAVTEGMVKQNPRPAIQGGRVRSPLPGQWSQLAAAFLKHGQRSRLLVAHDGKADARYHTVLGTLAAYGAEEITPIGRASLGMLSYAVAARRLDGGLLCRQGEICLLDRHGLLLSDRESANLEAAVRRQELPAPHEVSVALKNEKGVRGQYIRALAREGKAGDGAELTLRCGDPWLEEMARDILTLAGYQLKEQSGIRAELREDSLRLTVADQTLTPVQLWELCAQTIKARGETVYDTADVGWYALCDSSAACLRQRRTAQDSIATLLLVLSGLSGDALAALKSSAHRQVDIPCDITDKGRVLEALLADAAPRPQGGLAARHGDARAIIRPDPALPLMHVAVSAHSAEYAQELCDLYAGKVLRALRSKDE